MTFIIDPEFRDLIPPLRGDELANLEASILADGCREALIVWKDHGIIIDGHHRYVICTKHSLSFETIEKEFASREAVMIWMIDNQLARRNIADAWRITLVNRQGPLKAALADMAKERQREAGEQYGRGQEKLPPNSAEAIEDKGETREKLASIAGVGKTKFSEGTYLDEHAPDWIKAPWLSEDLSTNRAYKLAKLLHGVEFRVLSLAEKVADFDPEKADILKRLFKSMGDPDTNGTFEEIERTGGFHYGEDMKSWCEFKTAAVQEIAKGLRSIADYHAAESVKVKGPSNASILFSVHRTPSTSAPNLTWELFFCTIFDTACHIMPGPNFG